MNRIFWRLVVCWLCLVFNSPVQANNETKIKVVASFSILKDMVGAIGQDRINLEVLVGPNSDGHLFEPKPSDAKRLSDAEVFFVNGLGFEGWIDRLVAAAGFKGQIVVASQGIAPLSMVNESSASVSSPGVDPHAWQSLANARIYAGNIATALMQKDPNGRVYYQANLAAYLEEINRLEKSIRTSIASIPLARRTVITSHDAFNYYAAAYGLQFRAPQGVSTHAEASAAGVAELIKQIRAEKIPAIFIENITDPRLMQQIQRETQAVIGGTLYSDALSTEEQPANTYLNLMQHNTQVLVDALK